MKISEKIKRLGNGLIERTTVETEIDTKIKYIPIHKATKAEINHAFADAGLVICALSDKIRTEHDIALSGAYKLWKAYRSNLYDSDGRLVFKDALCHQEEICTDTRFLEIYENLWNPDSEYGATAGLRVTLAIIKLLKRESYLSKAWEDKKFCAYVMGRGHGENNIKIYPEKLTKDKSIEFCRRLEGSFDEDKVGPSKRPFALLLSLSDEDSAALKYFKANPQALESILIGNCRWMVENVKLKHIVCTSAATNEVVEEKYEFVFDNQSKE